MEQNRVDEEVNSRSGDPESLKDSLVACKGTTILLNGRVLKDGAIFVETDHRNRKFSGVLLEIKASDFWGSERCQFHHSLPQKIKESKMRKMPETKRSDMTRSGSKQKTFSSSKRLQAYVNTNNILNSKLRYGRDKSVNSRSSFSSSPRPVHSENSLVSSSGSDVNSVSVSDSGIKITSLEKEKCLDETFISESSTLPKKMTDDCHSSPQKKENYNLSKVCEAKEAVTRETQKNYERLTSSEVSRSWSSVSDSNTLESSFRFGSDRWVTPCSSCPSSSRLHNSGNRTLNSSGSDMNSVSVSDLKETSLKNEKCLDETFVRASESPTLVSKNTDDYHSPSQKIKSGKPEKTFETKESDTKRTQTNDGSFTSMCSNEPRFHNSGNDAFLSSVSDVNSVSLSGQRNGSLNFETCFDQNVIPQSELSTSQILIGIKCNDTDRDTHYNEVEGDTRGLTETMDNLSNKFDNMEQDEDSMPRISSDIDRSDTDEIFKENLNSVMSLESSESNDGMPTLKPIKPFLPRLRKVSSTCSDNPKSHVEGFTDST